MTREAIDRYIAGERVSPDCTAAEEPVAPEECECSSWSRDEILILVIPLSTVVVALAVYVLYTRSKSESDYEYGRFENEDGNMIRAPDWKVSNW